MHHRLPRRVRELLILLATIAALTAALPSSAQEPAPIPTPTPVVPIPPPVEPLEDDDAIQNILLLGADTSASVLARTDVLIVVSINRRAGSVALWHVPRDLFVYIPGATMDRINVVYQQGAAEDGGAPGAFRLLQETFLYNFGLPIDHYALVNFTDFETIVGWLGGLTVSVDCAIEDWRLIDSALDPALEESWEKFILPIGRRTLSPDMALWYVRSRQSTNDFDRGRRQMDALRAIWQQARAQGLFGQLAELGPELLEIVETDMSLGDLAGYAPLALALEPSGIARYGGSPGAEYQSFLTPDDGRAVQLPVRDALIPLLRDFLTPPTGNRLRRAEISVEIVDASYLYAGFAEVAADRLAWAGYAARVVDDGPTVRREGSVIYDYTGLSKGSPLP
ncbi:MAG: LCP family protein, partial [Anaerolineae bacterium]|nr:LCP family protein [Anaerolineae bacterium]